MALVTIVLPAHNAEKFIGSAIVSVLGQSYRDFELWILENGSTDNTAEVARGFSDPRLRVFSLGPVGFQGALQYALEHCGSPWVARMDADDLMFPERLERQMEVIAQRPDLVFVGTAYAILTPFGHIFVHRRGCSREVDTARLVRGRYFGDPTTVFNRRLALEVGGYDHEFTMGDVPLWFRLLQRGKGWEMEEPLHLYRLQLSQMSTSSAFVDEAWKVRRKYGPEWLGEMSAYRPFSRWLDIAWLEMLAGHTEAARKAIDYADQQGLPRRDVWAMRLRVALGPLAAGFYQWRAPSYNPRPDLERLFAPLLNESKPQNALPIAPGVVS